MTVESFLKDQTVVTSVADDDQVVLNRKSDDETILAAVSAVVSKSSQIGIWNPTIYGSSTAGSYSATIGNNWWIRNGYLCVIHASLNNITGSGGTGNLTIGGNPFIPNDFALGSALANTISLAASSSIISKMNLNGTIVIPYNISGTAGFVQITDLFPGLGSLEIQVTFKAPL